MTEADGEVDGAAAELLGLPRSQRLEAVRRHDVRHAVQQGRGVPGEVGVPGVGVDQVGAGDVVAERLDLQGLADDGAAKEPETDPRLDQATEALNAAASL